MFFRENGAFVTFAQYRSWAAFSEWIPILNRIFLKKDNLQESPKNKGIEKCFYTDRHLSIYTKSPRQNKSMATDP